MQALLIHSVLTTALDLDQEGSVSCALFKDEETEELAQDPLEIWIRMHAQQSDSHVLSPTVYMG